MVKLEYVLEQDSGKLELEGLSNYESKTDILESIIIKRDSHFLSAKKGIFNEK